MRHIFERHDVLIQVDYELASDGTPTFSSARVLGEDYKPVGPNLMALLDKSLLCDDSPEDGGTIQAERFFSAVVEDILCP